MPWTRPTSKTWVALGLLLAVVLLFTVFLVSLSAATPKKSSDQCSKPVSQRTAGWVCP